MYSANPAAVERAPRQRPIGHLAPRWFGSRTISSDWPFDFLGIRRFFRRMRALRPFRQVAAAS